MNFLGMGPGELVLIIIIALIVLGPGKLPEVARAFGKTMREFRSITDSFQGELRKEFDAASAPVKDDLQSIKKTLDVTSDSAASKAQTKTVTSTTTEATAEAHTETYTEAVPDDSFTEEYQQAQGGSLEARVIGMEEAAKKVAAAQPQVEEVPPDQDDDDQPVEYAPPVEEVEETEKVEEPEKTD